MNAGYFLGYSGRLSNYLRHPLRTVIGDSEIQRNSRKEFTEMIEREGPDAVLLQEVDQGSIRSSRHSNTEALKNSLPDKFDSCSRTKYSGVLSRTPFSRNMSNMVAATEKVENHYLDKGTKSLVQEIQKDSLSIFSVHLARFGKKVRRKQMKQIKNIAEQREKYIVAGDFNFMKASEIETARKIFDKHFHDGKTFPADSPEKPLDMAFSSDNLDVAVTTLEETFSDHRPIRIEI
ncbi:endonuclease/exonuclease/phosphatase family protein [Candidatus Nanohalovita haloferacivicina]|uniref:endonuclease/exonuclease/phosphatase family protein n=1 Tax=Candidatus Nanohalovita haloferacivicina TaxID=2978046 RepID=UPI00325FD26C|nr:Endonuclease/exonuclease/phosphatase family protein [Candidatus Nanohalobia archaeon BNXNv]